MSQLIGTLVIAWLAADLLAGFWHWLEDRYFDVTWPLIGEYIAKPNELHHAQPRAFLNQGYWDRNWTTIIPASVALLIAWASGASSVVLLTLIFVSQANEIHAWAHSKGTLSPWVVMLQETGLFQSPAHHAEHHRSPFAIRYCVMTNFLNPVLDHFEFWTRLEWLFAKFGVHPRT
jgi:ubiquitin-conjugating enzyme E2 variant